LIKVRENLTKVCTTLNQGLGKLDCGLAGIGHKEHKKHKEDGGGRGGGCFCAPSWNAGVLVVLA
jgi:hypothetical protein